MWVGGRVIDGGGHGSKVFRGDLLCPFVDCRMMLAWWFMLQLRAIVRMLGADAGVHQRPLACGCGDFDPLDWSLSNLPCFPENARCADSGWACIVVNGLVFALLGLGAHGDLVVVVQGAYLDGLCLDYHFPTGVAQCFGEVGE